MNSASLTVYGDDLVLQSIREVLPSEPEHDWRKGDETARGRASLDSGFELRIAEAETAADLIVSIRAYLKLCESRGITFAVPRIVAELRLACAPGAGIYFEVNDLAVFVEFGICVAVDTIAA